MNNILKNALIRAMEEEERQLKEELRHTKPHVFSDKHTQEMNKILKRAKAKGRIFQVRYAAAILAFCIVAGTAIPAISPLQATSPGIDIEAWFHKYFTLKWSVEEFQQIDFQEEQITYIPEGFYKTAEHTAYSEACYKYTNGEDYFSILVLQNSVSLVADNEAIDRRMVLLNNGYECLITQNEALFEFEARWQKENLHYTLIGSVDVDILIQIANGIQ